MTDSSVRVNGSVSTITSGLLNRAREEDQAAWNRLVDIYSPLVFFWCRLQGLTSENAADIGQEVFLAVARNLKRFRRDRPQDTFRGWLRRITENKITDAQRRASHERKPTGGSEARRQFEQVPFDREGDRDTLNDEMQILVRQIIEVVRNEYSESDWAAFSQVVLLERKAADVAQDLGVSKNKVYLAKSRILARLRQEYGESVDGILPS